MILLLVATVVCVLANGFGVAAKVTRARFMVGNAAEVGVPAGWIPYLAALEGAGVAGLLLGLLGLRLIGVAAAAGLVVFFLGAVGAHVRARVFHNIAFPGCFLVLSVAALAFFNGGG
jgi:hypothetical protein